MVIIMLVENSLLHVLNQSRNNNWQVTADELEQYQTIAKERSSHFIGLFLSLEA